MSISIHTPYTDIFLIYAAGSPDALALEGVGYCAVAKGIVRKIYFDMADEYGYKVVFIHLTTQFQNQHGVPEKSVENMRNNYVSPTSWEMDRIVKSEDMSDELIELLEKVGVKYAY